MMSRGSIFILGELHRRESASLLRYLAESPSYISPAANRWMPALRAMGLAGQMRRARLEAFLEAANELHNAGGFPTHFASLHYLSMSYLVGRLLADKRALAAAYAEAVVEFERAAPGVVAPAVAEFIRSAAGMQAADLEQLRGFLGA